jgi:hypothetical protein
MGSSFFVSESDVRDHFEGKSTESEELINSLIRSVAFRLGMDLTKIRYDQRTFVPDGGRDIVVDTEHKHSFPSFIPQNRSFWSIKSGKDALQPSTLIQEISTHPKVLDWLKNGNIYVWCCVHSSTVDQRLGVEDSVEKLIKDKHYQWRKDQIEFRWIDVVTDELNQHPAVGLQHLPTAARRLKYPQLLSNMDFGATRWIDFEGRDDLVGQVIGHLTSNEKPNVIHLAGVSGIGKTRLVHQACEKLKAASGIDCLYFPSYDKIRDDLKILDAWIGDRRSAIVILDEVPFGQELKDIESLFDRFAKRVRVITISPAIRQPTQRRSNIILLQGPLKRESVIAILESARSGVEDTVIRRIAEKSAHDLKFAIMLLDEARVNRTGILQIFERPVLVLERLLDRHASDSEELSRWREFYIAASCFLDIGIVEEDRKELTAVCDFFKIDQTKADAAVSKLDNIGLANKSRRFFEAIPRGLAELVFSSEAWPQISNRLAEFFEPLPDRLKKRFLERCHECASEVREEVQARLGDYFLNQLKDKSIFTLEEVQVAKTFSSWAQFDPKPALSWLKEQSERCTLEQLSQFSGREGFGDYRGRRYIVWLCESLVRFPEYFYECESILFRLALAENEPGIVNNATSIWKSLFWPTLSQVAIPFDDRIRILDHRLKSSDTLALRLAIDGAFDLLQPRTIGVAIPARVVGGRLAPDPWRPKSKEEFQCLRSDFAGRLLELGRHLIGEAKSHFDKAALDNFSTFAAMGLVEELRGCLGDFDRGPQKFRTLEAIERSIAFLSDERHGNLGQKAVLALRSWQDAIDTLSMSDRVLFWISRNPWDLPRNDQRRTSLEELAEAILQQPVILEEITESLSNSGMPGTILLARQCTQIDMNLQLDEMIGNWILRGICLPFVIGALQGAAGTEQGLDSRWRILLDRSGAEHGEYVCTITAYADITEAGFRRIAGIVDRGGVQVVRILEHLAYGDWNRIMTTQMQTEICRMLEPCFERDLLATIRLASSFLYSWSRNDDKQLPAHLQPYAERVLAASLTTDGAVEEYQWIAIAEKLMFTQAGRVATLALRAETDEPSGTHFDSHSLDRLLIECARVDAAATMQAMGEMLSDQRRRDIYEFHRHEGIFEAIGLSVLRSWIEKNGSDLLPTMASHFKSPSIGSSGEVELSEVLHWLFTEHEFDDAVFRGFLDGRHRMEISFAKQDDESFASTMKPLLDHPLRRVQAWAAFEIEHAKRLKEMVEDHEDRFDRS